MWNPTSLDGSNAGPDPSSVTRTADSTRTKIMMDSSYAFIGKTMVIKGEISGAESVVIDGKVDGSIHLAGKSVSVGPTGKVVADVNASEIIISGSLQGKVSGTDRVDIRNGGSLNGDVTTRRISIEEGAQFSGSIDMQGVHTPVVPAVSTPAVSTTTAATAVAAPAVTIRTVAETESVSSNLAIGQPIP